jgi:hypothetical protein
MKDINKDQLMEMKVTELRALVRLFIREGKIHLSASESRDLLKHECIALLTDALDGKIPCAPEGLKERSESKTERLLRELREAMKEEEEAGSVGASSEDMEKIREEVKDAISEVSNRVDGIEDLLKEAFASPKAKKKIALKVSSDKNPIVEECLRYYRAGEENTTKLLLLSPPSFGKSHAVRELGKSYDLFLEHGCSKAIDEIDTLRGDASPDSEKGGFVTVDGKVSQAVREASSGKTVLLFLDEALRWSENTQAFLLTFLQGVKKEAGLFYQISTKKTSGGNLETIECKAENLHIICGANLTAETPVGAFWSRFRKHRIEFTNSLAQSITKSICLSHGVEEGRELNYLAEAFADAMETTRDLVKKGSLFMSWDFRNLEDAIHAGGSSVSEICSEIGRLTPSHSCLWDMDTGDTLADSATCHKGVYDRFLSHAMKGVK